METRAKTTLRAKKTTSEDGPKEPSSPDPACSPGSEIGRDSRQNLTRKSLRIKSDSSFSIDSENTDSDYKPGDTSEDGDESTKNADSITKDESLAESASNDCEEESISTDHQSSPPKSNYVNKKREREKETRKRENENCDTTKSSKTNFWNFVVIIVSVGTLLCLSHLFKMEDVPPENIVEVFGQEFSNLPTAYPHQNEKVWRVIRSTMKRHLKDQSPKEPVVIMIVSTPEAAEERENIAKEAAEKYSIRCRRNGPVVVYGNNYKRMDNAFAKEEIDKKITDAFHEDSCAAVISNFHMLPPASTTVFYQFCENDNAPFKNVSVIFTLEVEHGSWDRDQEYLQLRDQKVPEPRSWDGIVEMFLYHNLENRDPSRVMTKDMISGLLSRITPSVVWVGPEPREGEL